MTDGRTLLRCFVNLKCYSTGSSLVVQWLTFTFQGRDVGLIPGRGAEITHALVQKSKTEKIL